jgi:hypothetical protein
MRELCTLILISPCWQTSAYAIRYSLARWAGELELEKGEVKSMSSGIHD